MDLHTLIQNPSGHLHPVLGFLGWSPACVHPGSYCCTVWKRTDEGSHAGDLQSPQLLGCSSTVADIWGINQQMVDLCLFLSISLCLLNNRKLFFFIIASSISTLHGKGMCMWNKRVRFQDGEKFNRFYEWQAFGKGMLATGSENSVGKRNGDLWLSACASQQRGHTAHSQRGAGRCQPHSRVIHGGLGSF